MIKTDYFANTRKYDECFIKNNIINVLDHGYVRLIDWMGDDLSIIRAARNSYDAAWRTGENEKSDEKLINYLWKNKHSTPFESVTFTFEVKAPIFVFRQWHRHRTWSYNEVSARYTELPDEFYIPKPEHTGIQSKNNKQGREIQNLSHGDNDFEYIQSIFHNSYERSFAYYRALIDRNIPRELARCVLPVGIYSKMFATVNLLNLLKFITLRDHEHAQYEIKIYAQALKKLIEPIVPVTIKAFDASQTKN